jgi:hypothetical protein
MTRNALKIALGVTVLATTAGSVYAQAPAAEVRTYAGQTYRLTDVSLDVRYTIQLPKQDGSGAAEDAPTTGAKTPMLFGSAAAVGRFLDKGPEPLQGHRQSETLTLSKDGVETRVTLTEVSTLTFMRQRIRSGLPPHVAPQHYRYAATAVMVDGTIVEGDYVNLGTTVVRGGTPHGRIDIPWEQIETVRFTR